jgi:hypothetical protein
MWTRVHDALRGDVPEPHGLGVLPTREHADDEVAVRDEPEQFVIGPHDRYDADVVAGHQPSRIGGVHVFAERLQVR